MSFRIVIISSEITECFSAEQGVGCLARGIARVLPTAELLRAPLTTESGATDSHLLAPPSPSSLTLEALLREADLVFTVEEHGERQPPQDSIVAKVRRQARGFHVPVIALLGTIDAEAKVTLTCQIDAGVNIPQAPCALSAPLSAVAVLLEDCVEQIMRLIMVGRDLIRREDRSTAPAWQAALAARVNALRKPTLPSHPLFHFLSPGKTANAPAY